MMISEKTSDALKTIGLNLYERKIYAALIMKSVGTAGELAELASVPRSRAYDVLETLAEKGFAVVQHTKPIKYVAIDPAVALDKTRHILKSNFSRHVKRIDQFSESDALTELSQLYSSRISVVDPSDISGSFKGTYSITMQFNSMIKKAQSSIYLITTDYGAKKLWQNNSSVLVKAKDRGVNVKIIAPFVDVNKNEIESLKKIADIKDLSKLDIKAPVGKMFVSDEREVLLWLTDDNLVHESQQAGFWSSSEHFTKGFATSMFNMIWDRL